MSSLSTAAQVLRRPSGGRVVSILRGCWAPYIDGWRLQLTQNGTTVAARIEPIDDCTWAWEVLAQVNIASRDGTIWRRGDYATSEENAFAAAERATVSAAWPVQVER